MELINYNKKREERRKKVFGEIFKNYYNYLRSKINNNLPDDEVDDMLQSNITYFLTYHYKIFGTTKYKDKIKKKLRIYKESIWNKPEKQFYSCAKNYFFQRFFRYFSKKNIYYYKKDIERIERKIKESKINKSNSNLFYSCYLNSDEKEYYINSKDIVCRVNDKYNYDSDNDLKNFKFFVINYDLINDEKKKKILLFLMMMREDIFKNSTEFLMYKKIIKNLIIEYNKNYSFY